MLRLSSDTRKRAALAMSSGLVDPSQRPGRRHRDRDAGVGGRLRILDRDRPARRARGDGVHVDVVRRELGRHRAGEGDDTGLGRGVVGMDGLAGPARRGDVDDLAVAALHHVGGDQLRAVEGSPEVDPHRVLPLVLGDLPDRVDDLTLDASDDVHEDVDASPAFQRGLRGPPRHPPGVSRWPPRSRRRGRAGR